MNNSEKYFFHKTTELLHKKAFDTYRVNLHNPYTIFAELNTSIEKLNKKRIKRFDPNISSIGEEAVSLIREELIDSVFQFGSFSKKQAIELLTQTCIKNKDGKKNRSLSLLSKTILLNNSDFKTKLFEKIKELILEDTDNNFTSIDILSSWIITQLLSEGYSRKFIITQIRKSWSFIQSRNSFENGYNNLTRQFEFECQDYEVIFKVKCQTPDDIKTTSESITKLQDFPNQFSSNTWVNDKFKETLEEEFYLSVKIKALDFWSALRKSLPILSETVEINILHDFLQTITVDKQVLIIHSESNRFRFTLNEESLDGFYAYCEEDFFHFVENFKKLKENSIAREKIRSAIRFYKLGNESIELEHKFLNYWIGFEQLFAAIDTEEDSISRIKNFYIPIHSCYYWQRRVNYLLDGLKRIESEITVEGIIGDELPLNNINDPLLKSRLSRYNENLKANSSIKASLVNHEKRLEQHLTRLFRVRNELVHEGSSSVDLFLITGHLRHYLLFSIEQITNEISSNHSIENLDDVFVYFENLLERIKNAENIIKIFDIKRLVGYME